MNNPLSSYFIWLLLSSWVESIPNQFTLSAPSAGTYTLIAELNSPVQEFTTTLNWGQHLSGSNNNRSEIFLAFEYYDASSEALEADTLHIRAGETGSDDPIRVRTYSGGELFSTTAEPLGLSSFGSAFSNQLTFCKDSTSSLIQINISNSDQGYTLPLFSANLSSPQLQLKSIGFMAKCTSSNTQNFSFGIASFSPTTFSEPLSINSHYLSSSAVLHLNLNQRLTNQISASWASSNSSINNLQPEAFLASATLNLPLNDLRPGIPRDLNITTIDLDTTISIVLTAGTEASFRDVVFTEIMANATPSMSSIPEDEYIEIYNCSNSVIDVNGWVLIDSDTPYNIIHDWDGLLFPDSAFIIVRTPSLWSAFNGNISECSSWSGLNDNGDHLQLLQPSGIAVDILEYEKSWWQEGTSNTQAGRSLTKIHPRLCNISSSWLPASLPIGSSPNNYAPSTTPQSPPITVTPHKLNNDQICLVFTPPIDPTSPLNIRTSTNNWIAADFEEKHWTAPLHVESGKSIFLEIDSIRNCQTSTYDDTLLEAWNIIEPANSSNIAITEICHSPIDGNYEWIEITKSSHNPIDLYDLRVNGTLISNEIFISNELFETLIIRETLTEDWKALSATNGSITLIKGNDTLDIVNYSKCWHSSPEEFNSGATLKRLNIYTPSNDPNNWCSSHGQWDASLGEYQVEESEIVERGITWSISEDKLIWNSSIRMDSTILDPLNWSFQTSWNFIDASQTSAVSEANLSWICLWSDSIYNLSRPDHFKLTHLRSALERSTDSRLVLNEVLPEPSPGNCKFIELVNNTETAAFANDFLITTAEFPSADSWISLSENSTIIPPGETIAFAECPSWIENVDLRSKCIELDLPSLQSGRRLKIAKAYGDPHDTFVIPTCKEGVSKERLCHDLHLYVDTPIEGATPGRENISHCEASQSSRKDHLVVWPRTLQRSNENFKWVNIEIEGISSGTILIYTLMGELVNSFSLENGTRFIWEGKDSNEFLLFEANYVLELTGENLDGKAVIEREIVAILD